MQGHFNSRVGFSQAGLDLSAEQSEGTTRPTAEGELETKLEEKERFKTSATVSSETTSSPGEAAITPDSSITADITSYTLFLEEQLAQLQGMHRTVEEEQNALKQSLSRFEYDLRILQATRSVRISSWVGAEIRKITRFLPGLGSKPTRSSQATVPPQTARKARQGVIAYASLPQQDYSKVVPTARPESSPLPLKEPKPGDFDKWFWERYSRDALVNCQQWDFDLHDLEANRRLLEENAGPMTINSITWFLPLFQHAYFGGIYTILRFAAYFKQHKGVQSRFVMVVPGSTFNQRDLATVRNSIGEAFPALADADLTVVKDYADLEGLTYSDLAVATLWSTAYYVLRYNKTRRKAYFIQDFEPLFYPAGSSYAQAEASYRFGFVGVTNTQSLKQIYEQQYGAKAVAFTPSVDTNLFQPALALTDPAGSSDGGQQASFGAISTRPNQNGQHGPYRVFFYGRPGQPRNAFELGITALRLLKERLGDGVEIVSAGANWEPRQYGVERVIENLGLLSYKQTARLYQSCQVGLSMMFTKHPSYLPFELMASGCLVVANDNPATSWLLRNRENCLTSPASASCLALTLELGLRDPHLRKSITYRAWREIEHTYANWETQIEKVYDFLTNKQPSEQ